VAAPPAKLALRTAGLTKSYGELVALEPLDLSVPAGQRLALVGHNGSGKTTLAKMAAGLLEPTGGTVTVEGERAGSLRARALLSYVPDEPGLYDDLSVLEHIEFTCRLHGCQDWEDRAARLLDELGLATQAENLPSRFSRGMRQKTSIVLALVRPFAVLVVDEPFVGLDPPGREAFVKLMEEATGGGASILVATHQLDYAATADRCVALRDGTVVYDGPPGEIELPSLFG
jgi:ABC-type multidrug transport system ATPase subunit